MLDREYVNLIDIEVKGLYPQWQPSPKAVTLFRSVLRAFDYDIVKRAVNNCYVQFSGREPKLDRILKACRKYQGERRVKANHPRSPVLDFYISCIEHPDSRYQGRRMKFFSGLPHNTPWEDIVTGPAERARQQVQETYQGQWIIEPPEQKQEFAGDGLRGNVARQQTERNILAGPDSAGRRWILAKRKIHETYPAALQATKVITDEDIPF